MSEYAYTDAQIVAFVREWYGEEMARSIAGSFAADEDFGSSFVASVRRSLCNEMERMKVERGGAA